MDFVFAVAQHDDAVDDAARVGGQCSFGRLVRRRSADDRPRALPVVRRDLTGLLRRGGRSALEGNDFAAEEEVADLAVGCTMTWVAVMVVPLVVPRTRTDSPLLMAPAEVEPVPVVYLVEDALVTVTVCPAEVDRVKLDVDTLATVPTAPPAAGPERAFDPPRPGANRPGVAEGNLPVVAAFEPLPAAALTMP
jgi:hypothetical protein